MGATEFEIEQSLLFRDSVQHPPSLLPLPGLHLSGKSLYYWNHPLPSLGQISNKLSSVIHEGLNDVSKELLDTGLVVQTGPPNNSESTALVISPHQDDAALSIGGTIASRRTEESHVICNVFTVSGWLGKGFRPSPLPGVTKIRQSEEDLSNQILSATGLGLGLWEAEVANYYRRSVDSYPTRTGFVFADDPFLRTMGERDSIHRGIDQIVRSLSPKRLYFPLGLGSHMDHVYLAKYGRDNASRLKEQYPNCDVYFFEDQPYATYDEVNVRRIVDSLCGGSLQLSPEYQNITNTFEIKVQSIAAHRSQFARLENEQRLKDYAASIAKEANMSNDNLAERLWRMV